MNSMLMSCAAGLAFALTFYAGMRIGKRVGQTAGVAAGAAHMRLTYWNSVPRPASAEAVADESCGHNVALQRSGKG